MQGERSTRRLWAVGGRRTAGGLLCGLALVGGLAARPSAAESAGGSWSARSAHVEAISSESSERARELALQLERVLVAAGALTGADPDKLPPLTALSLRPDEGFSFLRPLSSEPAFLQVTADRAILVLDASLFEHALTAAQHSLVHLLLASDPRSRRPLWLEEGAAELLSTARATDAGFELGRPPRARLEWFSLATLHPLRRVLTATETLRWSSHAREGFAAESWALLHFLLEGERLGFLEREAQLARYLALVRDGAAPERACAQAFGAEPAALEAELLRYLSYGELPRRELPYAALPAGDSIEAAALAPADRDALLGALALSLGARAPAERWLRSAALARPVARAQLAQLLAERGSTALEGQALIPEAELAAPGDTATLRSLAHARLALAAQAAPPDPVQLGEAQRLFEASLRAAPSQVGARIGLAQLALARGDRAEAEAQLLDAHERAPALGALDVELARVALDAGDLADARRHLGRVLARSHENLRGTSAGELEALLARARVDAGGPIATRHLTAHLEVSAPPALRGASSIEIRGRGGRWEATFHDVVIALDESESTLIATGRDIDGNGRTGRNRTWRRHVMGFDGTYAFEASGDPGDAVVSAEVAAAKRLIAQLDPDAMRVALVSFSGAAWIDAPLGAPAPVLRQLHTYVPGYHDDGTSLAAALRTAFDALNASRDREHARHRAILLLSDGQPTAPTPQKGVEQALEAADDLARYGVPVHTFAIGPAALARSETYREIASRTGGRFVAVQHPAEVVSLLRSVRLTGLDDVAIRNLSTQQPASSFRMLPDGSFRARVPVAPGANLIEVVASVEGRAPLVVRRQVMLYEGSAADDPLAPVVTREPEEEAGPGVPRERKRLTIEVEKDAERRRGEAKGDEHAPSAE